MGAGLLYMAKNLFSSHRLYHLKSGTDFQSANLNDTVVQSRANSGSLSLRVRPLFDNES